MKKSADRDATWSTIILFLVCGVLIGFLGSSLYWKYQAEKEISRALTGKHFVDTNGRLYYVKEK